MQFCKKVCIFCLLLFISGPGLVQSQDKAQILVLNSYHRTHPWTEAINQALQDTMSAAGFKVDWHFEYMDSKRFKPTTIFPCLEELYRSKYQGCSFDLIITTDNDALDFILSRRSKLFPDVPIVFCGINGFTADYLYGIKKITGVVEAADLAGTIELALKLQPETQFVAVVCDNTPTGKANKNKFRKIARNFAGRVGFIELFDKTISELVVGLKNLPDKSVVLELSFYRDREGKSFSVKEQAVLFAENSRFPVYNAWDFFLGLGVAGGVMVSGRSQGENTARLAMRILNGETPDEIPVLTENINMPMLDYNVIKKFHIPTSRIPVGTTIINQPNSFYEKNKRIIWQAIIVILILLIFICILIVIIFKRRRLAEKLRLFNEQLEQNVATNKEKLNHREAELTSIFRASPTGIGVIKDRVFQKVNARFCEIVGYYEEELLGANVRMLYRSEEEYERVGSLLYSREIDTVVRTVETEFVDKDGRVINVIGSLSQLVEDDLSLGTTFVVTDITEIRSIERKLHQSENRFRLMMESMNDPVYVCSSDFLVEYMNPEMMKMVGRDAVNEKCYQAIYGLTERCPWCENIHGSHGKHFESDLLNPLNRRYYHISHSVIINHDDTVSNMAIFRDTTEIKKLEGQLRQVHKMESIGTLAAGIAHDFNNILTAIYGYSELVLLHLTESSKEWHDVDQIQKLSEKAAALTQQLLTFSRNQRIVLQEINFNSFLMEMGDMLGRLLGEDINLETSLDVHAGRVMADPTQLQQIVINLLVNARDALMVSSETTDKTIKISTSEVYLDEAFNLFHAGSSPGPHLLVEVSDNGCGISEEVLEHIFEPFYTTKAAGQGTGMGLATVYGIIKQNSGAVYVTSEPGLGTTFRIYWPIIENGDAAVKIKEKQTEPSVKGSETILFAEDDDRIREIIGRKFQQNGYPVISAANGREALEKARSHVGNIDLLFTDVVMPVMGGKELSDVMLDLYPEIKIIFVSGYLDDCIHKDILNKGIFINKPYSFKKIAALIRQLFDKQPA